MQLKTINNKLLIKSLSKFIKIIPINNICFYNNELVFYIKSKFLLNILLFVKTHTYCQYRILTCISGIDYLNKTNRFEVNYELLSLRFNNRIRFKISLNELDILESCENIFKSSSWHECEIWDMFGIFFNKHSSLKRILTDYGFEGFPLRKDFPLSGFVEIKYNEFKKRIVTESIELVQEYRTFNFISPWIN